MRRILLVDNYQSIVTCVSDELRDEGYQVITSNMNGRLLETIEWFKPNVVILEVFINGRFYFDLLDEIRAKYYDLPVIIYTASEEFKRDLRWLEANYCVLKNPDLSELKIKISMAIESTRFIGPKGLSLDNHCNLWQT